jgi:hypothetical protein
MLDKPSGLEKVSEEMWVSPRKYEKHKDCTVCGYGLLTEVEKATGLCYYHLGK